MRYFFYGTLLDPDIRAIVLGRRAPNVRPAILDGYRRVGVVGASYPILVADPEGWAEGELVAGLDRPVADRLAAYEGTGYAARRLPVRRADGASVPAWVFLPEASLRATGEPWDLAAWQRDHKAATLRRAAAWAAGR